MCFTGVLWVILQIIKPGGQGHEIPKFVTKVDRSVGSLGIQDLYGAESELPLQAEWARVLKPGGVDANYSALLSE